MVDLDALIKKSKIIIKYSDFDEDLFGILVLKNNICTAGINKNFSERMHRYLIVKYIYLKKHYISTEIPLLIDFKTELGSNIIIEEPIKRESHIFTRKTLVPTNLLIKHSAKIPKENLIKELSEVFNVDEDMIKLRLLEEGLLDFY